MKTTTQKTMYQMVRDIQTDALMAYMANSEPVKRDPEVARMRQVVAVELICRST